MKSGLDPTQAPSRTVPLRLAVLLVGVLAACEGGTTGPGAVVAVAVTPAVDTLTALGASIQFSAVATDASGAEVSGVTFTWSSSDEAVATVDPSGGLVTTTGGGQATIAATANDVSGSASIVVGIIVGSGGGTVTDESGTVTVIIPAGATSGDIPVTITLRDSEPTPLAGSAAGMAIELGPAGASFIAPVQVVVSGLTPILDPDSSFTAMHWASDSSFVEQLEVDVDESTGGVSVSIAAFSVLQLFRVGKFRVFNFRWEIETLRYYYEDGPVLTGNVERALGLWSALGALQFVRSETSIGTELVFEDLGNEQINCQGIVLEREAIGVACPDALHLLFEQSGLGSLNSFHLRIRSAPIGDDATRWAVSRDDGYMHVLAHEVGHALGIGHSVGKQFPVPVMEEKFNGVVTLAPVDEDAFCFHYDCQRSWQERVLPGMAGSWAINERGVALATGSGDYGFALWDADGNVTDISEPLVDWEYLNNEGVVAGVRLDGSEQNHWGSLVRRLPNGTVETVLSKDDVRVQYVLGINDSGQILATGVIPDVGPRLFVSDSNGLHVIPTNDTGLIGAIAKDGSVTTWSSTLDSIWVFDENWTLTTKFRVAGLDAVWDVNDKNELLLSANDLRQHFTYSSSSGLHEIEPPVGSSSFWETGLNNVGDRVGSVLAPKRVAYIRTSDGDVFLLGECRYAWKLNDARQIVGGTDNGSGCTGVTAAAIRWDPVR